MDVAWNLAWPAASGRRGDTVSSELAEHQMENKSQGANLLLWRVKKDTVNCYISVSVVILLELDTVG